MTREGNERGVATETVSETEWNSNSLKADAFSQEIEGSKNSNFQQPTEELTLQNGTNELPTNGVKKDSPELLDGVSYPYSWWPPTNASPVSTPYVAPPSPFFAAPYYYPVFPAASVISPGVPLSYYPFTLEMAIVHQIEYYLGEENLAKDTFLRQLMDSEMWVEIEKLVTFPKLSRLTTSVRLVARVLREFSFRVQVHDDDKRVRPTPTDSNEDRCLIIVKNIAGNVSKEDFLKYIQQEVGIDTPHLKLLSNMEDTWFVYCENENDAERLSSSLNSLSFHGSILEARRKSEDFPRHTPGEGVSDWSQSGRHTTLPMMTPNAWASQLPFQSLAYSLPPYGTSNYVPMNAGMYPYSWTNIASMYPLNTGVTDTSRNARTRRRGSNKSLKGNAEREPSRINENEMVSENKATTEYEGQMSPGKIPPRGRPQEKNLKNKTSAESHLELINRSVSSANDNQQPGMPPSRQYRNAREKYSNTSKAKVSVEPNLSLAEFPPLPSTNGKKLNSLFKAGRTDLSSANGGVEVHNNGAKALDAKETGVFSEKDFNISFEDASLVTEKDAEKDTVPLLSFGDLILTTENLSVSDVHESL